MPDNMQLFGTPENPDTAAIDLQAPLAERMRPRRWVEVIGQSELSGPEGVITRLLEAGKLHSLILWGPPGSGKTTMARIVAAELKWRFQALSAVMTGVRELRAVMQEAEAERRREGTRSILFIDEIHRFNKGQQDAILPFVERGSFVLIGATTENPSYEVNSALLSRCRVYTLTPLSVEELVLILERAQQSDPVLRSAHVSLHTDTLQRIASLSMGDARRALNIVEFLVSTGVACGPDQQQVPDRELDKIVQRAVANYDKAGDSHYDIISALHKSVRNSDPDAALYWLARMLESGEDPKYVARRVMRMASEDIGLADSRALALAVNAKEVVDFVGMPECELALAQAVLFMTLTEKNNSVYTSYKRARSAVRDGEVHPVPFHLRNAVTSLDKQEYAGKKAHGKGYQYAHDCDHGVADMTCLPEQLTGRKFFRPRGAGAERRLIEEWRERCAAAKLGGPADED